MLQTVVEKICHADQAVEVRPLVTLTRYWYKPPSSSCGVNEASTPESTPLIVSLDSGALPVALVPSLAHTSKV